MKAGDTARTGTLRLLRGAVKNEEIKIGHPLDESEVLKVLARESKQRKDSMEAYGQGGREDLVGKEKAELAVIGEYLPEAMSDAELGKLVDEAVSQLGATDLKQMGVVIGAVMGKAGGRADGGVVAQLVRKRLAG